MDPKPVEDDAKAQQTIHEAQDRRVPDDLVERLHEANGRADELRKRMEAAMDRPDYDRGSRTGPVGEQLRAAERDIEDLTRQIRQATPAQAKEGA